MHPLLQPEADDSKYGHLDMQAPPDTIVLLLLQQQCCCCCCCLLVALLLFSGKSSAAEPTQSVFERIDASKLQGALSNASVLTSLEVSDLAMALARA